MKDKSRRLKEIQAKKTLASKEKNPLTDAVDKLISDKLNEINFSKGPKDPNLSINIGRFGLQGPDSLRVFLLTPAGATVKQALSMRVAETEALKAEQQFRLREDAARKARIQAAFFLWLIEKKAHAAKKLKEYVEEQITERLKSTQPTPKSAAVKPKANEDMLQEILRSYTQAIETYQNELGDLQKEEKNLRQTLKTLEEQAENIALKHPLFEQSLNAIESNSQHYEMMSIEQLDEEIAQIQAQLDEQVIEVIEKLDEGDDVAARQLLNKQNALHIQLAALDDLRATKQNDKSYFNEQGEPVNSAPKAMYLVPKNEKIVIKNGMHYLLKHDQKFDDLTPQQKSSAQQHFQNRQPELLLIKNSVKQSMTREKETNETQTQETTTSIAHNREKQLQVEGKILLMQSLKANMSDSDPTLALTPIPTPTPKGQGTATEHRTSPSPEFIQFFNNNKSIFQLPGLTPKFITTLVDNETQKNPEVRKKIMEYLSKNLNLANIPSLSPLPHTTMVSLLENMARYGADPNKPSLGPIMGPQKLLEQAKFRPAPKETPQEKPAFHPSPFNTDPFK